MWGLFLARDEIPDTGTLYPKDYTHCCILLWFGCGRIPHAIRGKITGDVQSSGCVSYTEEILKHMVNRLYKSTENRWYINITTSSKNNKNAAFIGHTAWGGIWIRWVLEMECWRLGRNSKRPNWTSYRDLKYSVGHFVCILLLTTVLSVLLLAVSWIIDANHPMQSHGYLSLNNASINILRMLSYIDEYVCIGVRI